MRRLKPSRSMTTGSIFFDGFAGPAEVFASPVVPFAESSSLSFFSSLFASFAASPLSSSLSFARGEIVPFFKVAT